MNTISKTMACFALVSLFGTATAANIIFTDTQDWSANPLTISAADPFTWTHDITGLNGYIPNSEMFIESAHLTINLIDFENKGRETISFLIGSDGSSQVFNFKNLNNGSRGREYEMDLDSALFDLRADGAIDISVSAPTGSFQLISSTLTVVDPPISTIPEPASLALLSIGLLCCGVAYRPRISTNRSNTGPL
ncbi:MAG: hypothetical protein H6R07_3205 [Proteobacteria bacterium]|nr:hypothetical protein [Pseudomonadota bacterium]